MGKHSYQIYEITNVANNRIYIGKTRRSPYKRLEEHILGHCEELSKDINKYGLDNFKIKVLRDNLNRDDAKTMERFHIENASRKGRDMYNIYCTVAAAPTKKEVTPPRVLFGFLLQKLKRSNPKSLCKDDFEPVIHKLKHTKDKYIAVELDDYDIILVRKAN